MPWVRRQRIIVAAAIFAGVPSLVVADDTGMASMHAWQKVGKLTCFVEHTHYASSTGARDKKSATSQAVTNWQSFTAFEYGTVWANFNKATAKKISCNQSASGWSCDLEARPCR